MMHESGAPLDAAWHELCGGSGWSGPPPARPSSELTQRASSKNSSSSRACSSRLEKAPDESWPCEATSAEVQQSWAAPTAAERAQQARLLPRWLRPPKGRCRSLYQNQWWRWQRYHLWEPRFAELK